MIFISAEEFTKAKKECSIYKKMSLLSIFGGAFFLGITVISIYEQINTVFKFALIENQLKISLIFFSGAVIFSCASYVHYVYKEHVLNKYRKANRL